MPCLRRLIITSQILFADHITVRSDGAGDNGFSQAEAGFDDQLVGIFGYRVDGESDAAFFALDHFLDHHRHGDVGGVQSFLKAVEDGTGSVERGPAFFDVVQELFLRGVEKGT